MSEILHLTRDYEVSIWTLQDSFITVLGASSAKYRGRILNPEVKLVNDGTLEFTFSIPMYLDDGVNRIKNPVWLDVYNASVIMGMRKIKVIFNKGTDVERVLEFIITKVTKSHEKDKPQCDVLCEGLAFHELGKVGYKIEFSTDVLAEENYLWYIDGQAEGEEPIPTIDYWNLKKLGLEPYPTNGIIDSSKWYYKVEMDWSSFANFAGERASDKIYDEEYVIAWDENLSPANGESVITYKEKSRILDEKESNIYNLTLRLAETFGVFCRYEYGYDDNYHIKSRTVVYYNTGVKDKERKLSFTYPYSSTKVSREDDSVDIVTKLYVSTIEDNTTDSGLISITNSDANPTREDYLLNFDYLHDIHTITDEQYNEIEIFEKKIRKLNNDIIPLQNELLVKEDRLPRVEALAQIAENAKALDTERINNANRLKAALVNDSGAIVIDGMNAKTVLMLVEKEGQTYFFKAPEKGILVDTIRLYKKMDKNGLVAESEITNVGVPQYDEFNNFERMTNIPMGVLADIPFRTVYITFSYSPKLYYERIEEVWRERLAKDEADYTLYHAELEEVNARITELEEALDTIRLLKLDLIKGFERIMGPALREGYWTPDDYNVGVGERYTDYLLLKATDLTINNSQYIMAQGDSKHSTLLWDTEKFEDELESSYKLGVQLTTYYYPCVLLTSAQFQYILSNLLDTEHANPISILYYDYTSTVARPHDTRYLRSLAIGASVQLGFIYYNNEIKPVLLVTGITSFTNAELAHLLSNASAARLGYLTTAVSNNTTVVVALPTSNSNLNIAAGLWLTLNSSIPFVYPRCKINSLSLKNNETDLILGHSSNLLKEFEDYYVFLRVDNATESNYYITFKPEVLFKYGYNTLRIAINFILSNASTAVYLDAREILKENSKPKVTYTVDPNVFYEEFIYTAYNALNTIAFINDHELEFNWVQGYISELDLNLDFPGEDKIEIKNYKNKFEDLFSTIVAQTEAMEKNEGVFSSIGKVIGMDGSILGSALTGALKKVDLNYAFNNGKLIISEKDGIWGISDDGVVAFRGGGIFTSNKKDSSGKWIWNTGIVPQGINADLITAGQLDTNRIMVYAGDRLRFQLNGDGLFAYKSFLSDFDLGLYNSNNSYSTMIDSLSTEIDYGQCVVMNEDGLFLKAARGSYILNDDMTDYINLTQDVTRVALTWSGLTMRNWDNDITFFMSASTGDLFLSGTLNANKVYVLESDTDWNNALTGDYTLVNWYLKMFEDHVKVSENLEAIINKAGEILNAARESLTAVNAINVTNYGILSSFFDDIKANYTPTITTGLLHPWNFKTGDIWNIPAQEAIGNTPAIPATLWMAVSNWDEIYKTTVNGSVVGDETTAKLNTSLVSTKGWQKLYDGSFAHIKGATMNVDAEAGTIYLGALNKLDIESGGTLNIGANSYLNLTSNSGINMGSSGEIILTSGAGIRLINSTDITDANTSGIINKFLLNNNGITIGSGGKIKIESDNGIDIVSASDSTASVISINRTNGIFIGSSKKLSFSTAVSTSSGANVEIDPTRIIFGVTATENTSFFEMKSDYLIAGVGSNKTALESGSNPSNLLTGLKMTNSGIWLATQSGNNINLISLDNEGIKLGAVPSSGNSGSFILVAHDKILVGSTALMYINATNVELNSTYNGSGTAFRLGSSSDPELLFANGSLSIKGSITATSFLLASGATGGYSLSKLWLVSTRSTAYTAGEDSGLTWLSTMPSVSSASNQGKYLHTKITSTFGGLTTITYDVTYISKDGENGEDGDDAVAINGLSNIFWGPAGNKQQYVALSSVEGLLLKANKGLIIPRFTPKQLDSDTTNDADADNTDTLVSISNAGINFDIYSTSAATIPSTYIHLNSNGIQLKGKRISIDGDEIWGRDDIIVMNLNTSSWKSKVAYVEYKMRNKSDWVLILPFYNAKLEYNMTASALNRTIAASIGNSAFGNGASWYKYSIKGKVKATGSCTGLNFTFYLSNSYIDFNNYSSMSDAVSLAWNDIAFNSSGDLSSGVDLYAQGLTSNLLSTNLCAEGATLYLYVYGSTSYFSSAVLTVTCTCDATTSKVPCTVYYYPSTISRSKPTGWDNLTDK